MIALKIGNSICHLVPQEEMLETAKLSMTRGVKLAHKDRAALEQIQLSLGHASIVTTERYLESGKTCTRPV